MSGNVKRKYLPKKPFRALKKFMRSLSASQREAVDYMAGLEGLTALEFLIRYLSSHHVKDEGARIAEEATRRWEFAQRERAIRADQKANG